MTPDTPPAGPQATATPDGHHLIHAVTRHDGGARRVVLVVDDDAAIRGLVRRRVAEVDPRAQVVEAGDGRQALDRVEELRRSRGHGPDLVVLDLRMPVLDGWEFIAAMRRAYADRGAAQGVPIVVMSQTGGEKGWLRRSSVHDGKSGYVPLVTVAKDSCARPERYDTRGEPGLVAWLRHYLGEAQS